MVHILLLFIIVITSYSIHYTKLYDDRTGESVRTYSGEGNLPDSIIFDGKDNKGAVLSDGLYKGHILITSKNGGTSEDVSRITSYNVCYTKLLRLPRYNSGKCGLKHQKIA